MAILAPEFEPITARNAGTEARASIDLRGSRHRHDWLIVFALTILGAILRFAFLDRPPIWGDEAMTFMRVSGTYQQLLDRLRDDGFAPLHYELYWLIRRSGVAMTPFWMRLVPAICGTLMVPVMWWLAVQLVPRRAALVTALLTATSAYLLNYSRDAKMYMDFWLFCALSAATLLWWLRVRTLTSWLCWVAASCAMIGLNFVGAAVLAIELLIVLLSRPGHWRSLAFLPIGVGSWPVAYGYPLLRRVVRKPLATTTGSISDRIRTRWRAFCCPPLLAFGVGILIISAGPWLYHRSFNRYIERVERFGPMAGGIGWVEPYNRGRGGLDLLKYTATAYLYNWEWPRKSDRPKIDEQAAVHPRTLRLLKGGGIALGAMLIIGALPWPRRWRRDVADDALPKASWRSTLTIAAWIVIPTYACYVLSVRNPHAPPQWITDVLRIEVPASVAWPGFPRGDTLAESWTMWMETDAVGKFFATWGESLRQVATSAAAMPLRLFGGLALVVALLTCYFLTAGQTWRQRARVFGCGVGVALSLVLMCTIIRVAIGKPFSGSVWMPRYLGFAWPAFAIAVAVLLSRLPTRPLRWGAIGLLVFVNLAQFSARLFAGTEPPVDRMARDLLDAQPPDATARMYYGINQRFDGSPGHGLLNLVPGRYYLTVFSGRATNPREMLSGLGDSGWRPFKHWRPRLGLGLESYVVSDVKRTPQLQRIIVWDRLSAGAIDMHERLGDQLAPLGWKRTESKIFHARDHWTWRELYKVRRRVYERTAGPTTAPTTTPTTTPASLPSR